MLDGKHWCYHYMFFKYNLYFLDQLKNDSCIFINIWFAIRRLNKYILYAKGLSKGMQDTQSVKWNEMYKWKDDRNTQDTNLSSYVPKDNVDHTISGQGTGISTLGHSATTPRAKLCCADYIKCSKIKSDRCHSIVSW